MWFEIHLHFVTSRAPSFIPFIPETFLQQGLGVGSIVAILLAVGTGVLVLSLLSSFSPACPFTASSTYSSCYNICSCVLITLILCPSLFHLSHCMPSPCSQSSWRLCHCNHAPWRLWAVSSDLICQCQGWRIRWGGWGSVLLVVLVLCGLSIGILPSQFDWDWGGWACRQFPCLLVGGKDQTWFSHVAVRRNKELDH